MNDKTLITIVSMICITILEAIALFNKIDGALLSMVVAVLSGMAGYVVRIAYEVRRRR